LYSFLFFSLFDLFTFNSLFHKTIPIVPFPPTNLQLTQKTSTSAKISWTASSGVYYKIVLSSIIKQTNYQQTSFTLGSLTPSIYTVTVYSGKNNPSGGAETYETVGIFYFILFLLLLDINN